MATKEIKTTVTVYTDEVAEILSKHFGFPVVGKLEISDLYSDHIILWYSQVVRDDMENF